MSRRLETMETFSPQLHVKMALTLDERVPEFSDTLHNAKIYKELFCQVIFLYSPPLWSSGQSSWLQIRRPGFDSRHYQKIKAVGLERGPLSPVNTTEELLD
jgi:hypothetical protein